MAYSYWATGRFYTKSSENRIKLGSKNLKRLDEMGAEKIYLRLSDSEILDNYICKYLSGDLFMTGEVCPDTSQNIRDGRVYVRKDLREEMGIEDGSEVVVIGKPAKDKKILEIFKKEDYNLILDEKHDFSWIDEI